MTRLKANTATTGLNLNETKELKKGPQIKQGEKTMKTAL